MTGPALGAFGVVHTSGWVAWGIRWVTHSTVNHAFVYVGNGEIVEAEPSGALRTKVHYDNIIWSPAPPMGTGAAIAAAAKSLVGTPYSWLDCACVGLAHLFGWHIPGPIRARLNRRTRLMCSQLVDLAYLDAGVHLFSDGRIPGDVSPGDLLDLINTHR